LRKALTGLVLLVVARAETQSRPFLAQGAVQLDLGLSLELLSQLRLRMLATLFFLH
jgi:hypothetical protein